MYKVKQTRSPPAGRTILGPSLGWSDQIEAINISTPDLNELGCRMRQLDLIVSVDTMVAHPAGGNRHRRLDTASFGLRLALADDRRARLLVPERASLSSGRRRGLEWCFRTGACRAARSVGAVIAAIRPLAAPSQARSSEIAGRKSLVAGGGGLRRPR